MVFGLKKNNVILGAGGLAKEVFDLLIESGEPLESIVFADLVEGEKVVGHSTVEVLSDNAVLSGFGIDNVSLFNAIGAPSIRKRAFEKFKGWTFPNLISKDAWVSRYADLGAGNILCQGAVINAGTVIGYNNYIGYNVTIGHDSQIDCHTSIYPGANISGNVNLGKAVLVGAGSVILQGLFIAPGTTIGAGAVVTKSVTEINKVLIGVPAKIKPSCI